MTTNYHTAISVGAAANAATFNTPLGALDEAISNAQSGVYNVLEYGADNTGATATHTHIQAAIDACSAAGGGIVFLPAGTYKTTSVITLKSNINFWGANRNSTFITNAASDMFTFAADCSQVDFGYIKISTSAGHVFKQTDHLYQSRFHDLMIYQTATGYSIWYLNGAYSYLENYWEYCDLESAAGKTVPAFDLTNSNGGLNCNVWRSLRAQGGRNDTDYFWSLKSAVLGGAAMNNAFYDIGGEQNLGGLIYAESVVDLTIHNVRDYDALAGVYKNDIIYVGKNTTANVNSRNIYISMSGSAGGGSMDTGKYDIKVADGSTRVIIENCDMASAAASISVPDYYSIINSMTATQKAFGETTYGLTEFRTRVGISSQDEWTLVAMPNYASTAGVLVQPIASNVGVMLAVRGYNNATNKFSVDASGNTLVSGTLEANAQIYGDALELPHTVNKTASANVRNSHDAEASTDAKTLTKLKTITLNYGLLGQQRFLFDIKADGTNTATAEVQCNGVKIGATQTSTNAAYETKSQDITQDWNPGDTCELWVKCDATLATAYVQNFRIAYDDSPTVAVTSTNS